MRPPGPGVWITGPSRSGTSMVAGLFSQHNVFFGRTVEADEHNEKGYFEHPEIVSRTECEIMAGWPACWWKTLEAEGYQSGNYWGIKRGPRAWPWVRLLFPSLIVVCKRPELEVIRSRKRRWPSRKDAKHTRREAEKEIRKIAKQAACPVVTIHTDKVVAGDYARLNKAFERLGLWFSTEIADQWIDGTLWNRGPEKGGAK